MKNRRTFLKTAAAATACGVVAGAQAGPVGDTELGKTPHTRFAVNVEMWWPKLPFVRRLEEAARLGFPAVEFWPWQGKDIKAIADACKRLKIEIAQFTAWGFRPGLNDPKNHNR